MQRFSSFPLVTFALALLLVATPALAQDEAVSVQDGGIFVEGWQGRIDAREAARGQSLDDARLAMEDGALHIMTGPATTYWNPANVASGDYTVSATFHEPAYMSRMSHPHPYGIVIAGNDLGTDQQSYLYCAAYGNGRFIVRGFGPEPFQASERRPTEHPAVNRAAGPGEPVTQEIAVKVSGDRVECEINGTVVAAYDKADLVRDGKLKSTDGVYGVRAAHNTEVVVSGLTVSKP